MGEIKQKSCKRCNKLSVSKEFCTHATSLHHKPMPIEDLDKIPEWCPKKKHNIKEAYEKI